MIKSISRGFAVLGIAAALVACVPEFSNVLVGGDKADPALLGNWIGKAAEDEKPMALAITAEGEGVAVVMTEPASDGAKPDEMRLVGSTAFVGDVHYINLKPTGEGVPPETGYMIFRYAPQADGTIQVWHLDDKTITALVESGKLAGTVKTDSGDKSAKITASSDELAAYFATPEGQAAFSSGTGDVLVLTKAKP